jgi:hypothetical protein
MINRTLHWLRAHKPAAIIIAAVYAVITTVTHDLVQAPALAVQKIVGMAVWHYTLLGLIAIGLIGVATAILRSREIQTRIVANRGAITVLVVLTFLASSLLMVNSVEHIHMLQYLIMVFLLIPIVENSIAALLIAMLVGAFDEGYQFWVLHSWQGYLDFNDIILNSVGACWGVALFEVFYFRRENDILPLAKQPWRTPAIIWCALFAGLIILFFTGVLGAFADQGQVILSRFVEPESNGPVARWIDTEWGNHWYHVTPLEGLWTVFFLPLASFRRREPRA